MPQPLYAKKLQAARVHLSHTEKLLHATTSICREASGSMHAVAVRISIIQRMLLIELQGREERTKPGTRGQKAPCSSFVLQSELKEEETSSPARHYTSVPICRIRQPL
jgi:hypothetical protein